MSHTERARQLRRNQTEAERLFWRHVQRRQFAGLKFRRQAPMAGFIVDFVCHDKKLVVELDGGQHAAQKDKDDARTKALEALGYHVVRYWNNDVLGNMEGVLTGLKTRMGKD